MAHILDTCLITTKETPANRRSAWRCLLRSPAPDLLVCVTWLILMRLSCVLVRECLDIDCFIADLLVCVTWLILMKLPCVLVRECLNINFVIADLLVCVTGDYCPRTWFMSHMNESLQHTATHCNTLQHTATHCNTLQYTATHFQNVIQLQPHGSKNPIVLYQEMWLQRWLHVSNLLPAAKSKSKLALGLS